jgi:integrase
VVRTWTLLAALAAGLILGALGSRLLFRPSAITSPAQDVPPAPAPPAASNEPTATSWPPWRAGQENETTAHVLRHTFGTTLLRPADGRAGADLVLVAELMGHARLETTRAYTRPTALDLLPVDR